MKKQFCGVVLAAILTGSSAAQADPSFGFGLTYVFGGDWALGVRVFHDDEPESAVLALGFDYKFGSQAFRPTIGAAYLDEDFYIDFSLGYDTRLQALDYGIGVGAAFETEKPAAAGGGGATTTSGGTTTTGGATPATAGSATDTGAPAGDGGGDTDTGGESTPDSSGGTGSDGSDPGSSGGGDTTGGTDGVPVVSGDGGGTDIPVATDSSGCAAATIDGSVPLLDC